MPRINADSVAEHVAQQRAAVLEAAVHLFTERGFAEVSLGDIAGEVGLARNSLYRYVPDKVHLLVEWFRAAVPRTIADWEAAVSGNDPAPDRLTRWAHCYLEWARSPEHQLVAEGETPAVSPILGPDFRDPPPPPAEGDPAGEATPPADAGIMVPSQSRHIRFIHT